MRLLEAVDLIQGEPGQKVVLTVLHEGAKEPVDIGIVRDVIKVPSVLGDQRRADNLKEWDYFLDHKSKIGYIRLVNFTETAAAEMRASTSPGSSRHSSICGWRGRTRIGVSTSSTIFSNRLARRSCAQAFRAPSSTSIAIRAAPRFVPVTRQPNCARP